MGKKLIIFADYGLDDAGATISIFNQRQQFDCVTLVPVGGNVPVEMSFDNAFTLVNLLAQEGEKITVVDTRRQKQTGEYMAEIHGKDGMGDIFPKNTDGTKVDLIDFETWLPTLSGDETVLSLGPMTLVKDFLQRYPHCPLVLMGGCVREEPNFQGYEFNQALDPEAFAFCVKFPHVAITLDTCRTEKLEMRRLHFPENDYHSQVLRADQRLSITRGEDGCYVWDDIAACYILYPERFALVEETDRQGNRLTNAVYISEKEYFEA